MKPRYIVIIVLILLLAPVAAFDILQDKPKTQWTGEDWTKAGEVAREKGNYQEAIDCFNYAELIYDNADPNRDHYFEEPGYTDEKLAQLEKSKASTYKAWPGHKNEADLATEKSAALMQKSLSEAGSGTSCLIATATFDSPLAPQVQQLREFREDNIYSTNSGTQFMIAFNAWYYSFSPTVANFIDDHPVTKPPMRVVLTPLLGILTLSKMSFFALSFNPDIAVIVTGFVASTLIGMVYAFPVLLMLLLVIRKIHPFTFTTGVFTLLGGSAITGLILLLYGGVLSVKPVLLVGSVLFIVSLVLLTGLFLSWLCMNRLDLRSAHANEE